MFRKRKAKENASSAANRITDKAAIKIAGFFMRVQNAFARFMNMKTKGFSAETWKMITIVFAIAWGTLSIYFIASAFTKQPEVHKSSRIQFIIKPARNDSLAIMEAIYEQEIKKQRNKK